MNYELCEHCPDEYICRQADDPFINKEEVNNVGKAVCNLSHP